MTTSPFSKDYNQLEWDLDGTGTPPPGQGTDNDDSWTNIQSDHVQYGTDYDSDFQELFIKYKHQPDLLFMMFGYLLSNVGLHELDAGSGVYGATFKVQGDLQACITDIHNVTATDDSDSSPAPGSQGCTVDQVATDSDTLLNLLNQSSGWQPSQQNQDMLSAFGLTPVNSFFSPLDNIRVDIDDEFDSGSSYQPKTLVPQPPATGPRTYHFYAGSGASPTSGNYYITAYGTQKGTTAPVAGDPPVGGLQWDMAQQADNGQGVEGGQLLTTNFNTLSTTGGSVSSGVTVEIKNAQNISQTAQSFASDLWHSLSDTVKNIIQNMTSASS